MKDFFTYEQQLLKLESRGLVINDREQALKYLKAEGYYNLINGYAYIFKDRKTDEAYLPKTTFDNILKVYMFDKRLRNIVYQYISSIECHIKALVAHEFSRVHGVDENIYLQPQSFTANASCATTIDDLIAKCKKVIEEAQNDNSNKYRAYIAHNLEVHNHVPMWILVRAMSFGNISIFYKLMKEEEKAAIAKEFDVTSSQLENMLEVVVTFRNIVAHGERTYCARMPKTRLTTTLPIVGKLQIPLNNRGSNKYGKSDFLALMICFKYLLSPVEFSGFMTEFSLALDNLKQYIKSNIMYRVVTSMGIKGIDWKSLVNLDKT